MKKKKILLLVQLPPPVHGVGVLNGIISRSTWLREGYEACIVPIRVSRVNAEIGAMNAGKFFRTIGLFFHLKIRMIFFRPDMVYFTFSPVGLNLYRDCLLLLIVKCFMPKVVLHLHGVNIKDIAARSRILASILRRLFFGVSVVCSSGRLVDDVVPVYADTPFIVPNTIEYDPHATGIIRAPAGTGRILFLSHLQNEKGVDTFLDALAILRQRGMVFEARLAGNPFKISLPEVHEEIFRRGLSGCVTVLGGLVDSDKYRECSVTDILVFPSRNEAFPLVLIEAAAWGIPVVSSGVGAIRDIVRDRVNGFVIDGNKPDEYADKIGILLADTRLRAEMGRNARKIFDDEYTLPQFERNISAVFSSVLSSVKQGLS
ncbi:MAG: glycosyltransferase family 4 protein [Elusimicrobia bacterium]|nr:glycosyltransferase family 4 protein [Elusimicrobiota bacterium]